MTEIKDFGKVRPRVQFRVDGDDFEAAPAIPAEILAEFAARYEGVNEAEGVRETYQMLVSVLDLVLLPDSHTLLQSRLKDRANPVDIDQLTEIIEWLMEQYGLRPTRSSSGSSDGPQNPAPGTSSTASTPAEESTSQDSLPIAS